jgi:hypothetical protein
VLRQVIAMHEFDDELPERKFDNFQFLEVSLKMMLCRLTCV